MRDWRLGCCWPIPIAVAVFSKTRNEDEPIPDVVYTSGLVDTCVERWRQVAPLHRWLVKWLG